MRTLTKLVIMIILTTITIMALCGCTGPTGTQGSVGPQGPAGPVGPAGEAGVSVTDASVNSSGHLILILSNGQTVDAGSVIGPQGPAGTSTGSASSFASIVSQVEPKVVRIDVTLTNGLASGSGTIIDNRGFIVTNAHVVTGEHGIKVTLKDGTILSAAVVASDIDQDLAIIKLNTPRTDFPVITLGDMTDISVGEAVMAAGFPGGTDLPGPVTFTVGVASAMRTYNGSDYIQIDASVNPGNSGGCLVALGGDMIGIPTAGITPPYEDFEDINLAIPINQVTNFINQHIE